jgi:hypothetical protein
MIFRSSQYLRFFAVLLSIMLIACAANAQTNETGRGRNRIGDQPGAEFKPFSDGPSSNTSAENNKDCNTSSVIVNNIKMPVNYYALSLTPCITGQSQPVNNPQDQSGAGQSQPVNNPQDQSAPSPQKKDAPTKVDILTGIGHVSQDQYKPLTGKERLHLYLNQTFVPPEAYLGVLLSSAVDQIGNDPPEWGQGLKGYGIRFASRFGTNFVQNSIQAAGAAALHEEPRYVSSSSKGFFRRSEHALLFTLVTYNNSGKVRPAIASVGSIYAASMITTLWMPNRYTVLGDGVRDGNLQLGLNGAFNLVEEFLPDIKKVFKR